MKKLLIGLLTLAGMMVTVPAFAEDVRGSAQWVFEIPRDKQDVRDINAEFTALSTGSLSGSTTCRLLHTGKGILKYANVNGKTSDIGVSSYPEFFVAYDTNAAGVDDFTAGTEDTVRSIVRIGIESYKLSRSEVLPPLPYFTGLVVCNSNTSLSSRVGYYKQRQ